MKNLYGDIKRRLVRESDRFAMNLFTRTLNMKYALPKIRETPLYNSAPRSDIPVTNFRHCGLFL